MRRTSQRKKKRGEDRTQCPGKLSHRVRFIAQALVVFPSLLKSACKWLFYCRPGILLLQFFQVARHLGRDLIKLFAAISGVQSSFEAQ